MAKELRLSDSVVSHKVVSKATGLEGVITKVDDMAIYVNFLNYETDCAVPLRFKSISKYLDTDAVVSKEVADYEQARAERLKKAQLKEQKKQAKAEKNK